MKRLEAILAAALSVSLTGCKLLAKKPSHAAGAAPPRCRGATAFRSADPGAAPRAQPVEPGALATSVGDDRDASRGATRGPGRQAWRQTSGSSLVFQKRQSAETGAAAEADGAAGGSSSSADTGDPARRCAAETPEVRSGRRNPGPSNWWRRHASVDVEPRRIRRSSPASNSSSSFPTTRQRPATCAMRTIWRCALSVWPRICRVGSKTSDRRLVVSMASGGAGWNGDVTASPRRHGDNGR